MNCLRPRIIEGGIVVVVYYCRTYVKAVRGRRVKRGDVCYGMLRAAACVDESDHHALMHVWHGQTVREDRVGEAGARRPDSRGSYDAAVDVEIDPQSCRFRRSQPETHFAAALQAIVVERRRRPAGARPPTGPGPAVRRSYIGK